MRKGWTETTLGDIAEVLDRMRKPISGAEREKRVGDVPYYGATGQAGWIDKPIFDEELVLLGEDAIDFLNPDVHKAYLISGPSWVNNHAHVLRAKREKVLSFFLMEALNAVDYSQFVAFGTRSKLTQGAMMGISVLLPPLAEQKRIVDVVSSVDACLDALQQQADTARTARNAVLHQLLSTGGDDWTETTLGDIALVVNGSTPSTKNPNYWGGEIPWITTTELTACDDGFVSSSARRITPAAVESGGARLVGSGVTLVGTTATIGTVALAVVDTCFNQQISGLVPKSEKTIDEFLFVWTRGNRFQLDEMAAGTSFKRISTVNLKNIKCLLPPLDEQRRIVEIVSSMDEVIQSTEQAVVDAKNLRSGLLSDLLSGEHEIPESYDRFLKAA